MIEPTKYDLGRKVRYTGDHDELPVVGVITSFNEHNVFVRYGMAGEGVATRREDLVWE